MIRFRGNLILLEGGPHDSEIKTPYCPEFRQHIVALVSSGRTPESLYREFEPSAQSIRNWVEQTDRDSGLRADGLTST